MSAIDFELDKLASSPTIKQFNECVDEILSSGK